MQHLCCVLYQALLLNATLMLRFLWVALQSRRRRGPDRRRRKSPTAELAAGLALHSVGTAGFEFATPCGSSLGGVTTEVTTRLSTKTGRPLSKSGGRCFRTLKSGNH